MTYRLIVWTLIVQLAAPIPFFGNQAIADPPDIRSHNNHHTHPSEAELPPGYQEFAKALSESSLESAAPSPVDTHNLGDQVHYIYRTEITTDDQGREVPIDVIDKTISLNEVDSSNPYVAVANFEKQIRTVYDADRAELRFERIEWDKSANRYRLTDAHAIRNVKSTIIDGPSAIADANILLIPTEKGVRAIFTPLLRDVIFKAPIPNSVILPPAEKLAAGANITAIEFLSPESKPRSMLEVTGRDATTFRGSDVVFEITLANATKVNVRSDYGQLIKILGVHQAVAMLMSQLADPNLTQADEIEKILVQNAEAMESVTQLSERLVDGDDASASDLQEHALKNFAHHLNAKNLGAYLLSKDDQPNTFEKLASDTRHSWNREEWHRDYGYIRGVRQHETDAAIQAGIDPDSIRGSWYHLLVDRHNHPDADLQAKIIAKVSAEEKRKTGFIKALLTASRDYLKTKAPLKTLAAIITYDVSNQLTDGRVTQKAVAVISQLFSWTQEIPFLGGVFQEVAKTAPFYEQHWSLTTITLGVGAVLTFRPISYFIAQTIATIRGDKNPDGSRWDKVKAFFSYGIRTYAFVNYPVQKLLWEVALGQKNVYRALESGRPLTSEGVFHLPFSKLHAESQRKKLDNAIKSDAERHERALVLAAIAASEYYNTKGQSIDPATMLQLLESHHQNRVSLFIDRLKNLGEDVAWTDISQRIYRSLAKVDFSDLTADEVTKVVAYSRVLDDAIRAIKRQELLKGTISGKIQQRWKAFKRWTSKNALPFLFFGQAQYELFRKYRRAEMDDRNADTAKYQYDVDYDFSSYFYGAADPKNFFGTVRGGYLVEGVHKPGLACGVEVIGNQLEQIFIYGTQGGLEAAEYHKIGSSLTNPAPSLTYGIYGRDNKDVGGLEQGYREAISAIREDIMHPKEGRGVQAVLMNRMKNTLTGFQVRFMAGALFRMVNLGLIALASGVALDAAGWDALSGIPRQINVLFNKTSIVFTTGTLAMGYAMPWAMIGAFQNSMKDKAEGHRVKLQQVEAILEESVRLNNEIQWRVAVRDMLDLYEAGGSRIPPGLPNNADDYTLEQAKVLAEQGIPPVRTIANSKLQSHMNMFGAAITTVLFVELSNRMYDPSIPIGPQLAGSLTGFAVTYLGVKEIGVPFTKYLINKTRDWVDYFRGCNKSLGDLANH